MYCSLNLNGPEVFLPRFVLLPLSLNFSQISRPQQQPNLQPHNLSEKNGFRRGLNRGRGHQPQVSLPRRSSNLESQGHGRLLRDISGRADRARQRLHRLHLVRRGAPPHRRGRGSGNGAQERPDVRARTHGVRLLDARGIAAGVPTTSEGRAQAVLVRQPRADHEYLLQGSGWQHGGDAGRQFRHG